MVPLWAFLLALFWAVSVSVLLFYRNPLPVPDRGHRCFGVPSEEAASAVAQALAELGALHERFTFDHGPSHQTLLWDNTVILRTDTTRFAPNAISVAVRQPRAAARRAAVLLKGRGFTATVHEDMIPGRPDCLVLLASNAFSGWDLVFRLHAIRMGVPSGRRRLSRGQQREQSNDPEDL